MIDRYLCDNGVNTRFVERFTDGKTAVALAFLDEQNNADYTFFKIFPKVRLNMLFPEPTSRDIVLFGSFFSIDKAVRSRVIRFIRKARNAGALIVYDPNFRKPHLKDLLQLKAMITENISLADIVRGSDEDFLHIFGAKKGQEAYEKVLEAGCMILVYTRNRKDVEVFCDKRHQAFPVPGIRPYSTIGAGDAFNAGLISGLMAHGKDAAVLDHGRWKIHRSHWTALIERAVAFASDVCMSLDNSISDELANRMKHGQMAGSIHS
jgi:fructokinase